MQYRTEVDGLRALAVLLILLYHLGTPGFQGGYVGVDIFFVISGFLITGIILRDLDRQGFSFRAFYTRRITRILPALLATVLLSLLAATILMTPVDLVYAATQALAAVLSVSNIFYWQATGYWAPDAQNNLFLHTWSLGVEEQFYLFYPLLLFFVYKKWRRAGMLVALLALAMGGALVTESLVRTYPVAAFYLTPLRLYEFAIGGLGSLMLTLQGRTGLVERLAPALSLGGIVLIFGSLTTLDHSSIFPGLSALPVTLGTLLLILAGRQGIAAPGLRNPVVNWLGRASYSLYLVHWPIIVLYRYVTGPALSYGEAALLFTATMIVGGVLYHTVDIAFRIRGQGRAAAGNRVGALCAAAVSVVTLSTAMVLGEGWSWRVPTSIQYLAGRTIKDPWTEKRAYAATHCLPVGDIFCGRRDPNGKNIMILGDSRGLGLYVSIKAAYPKFNVYMSAANSCTPVFDKNVSVSPRNPHCVDINRKRLQAALDAPAEDVIFVVTHFNGWRRKYTLETVARMTAAGKTVYLVGQSQFIDGQFLLTLAVKHARQTGLNELIAPYLVETPFMLDGEYADQVAATGATFIKNRAFFSDGEDGYRLYTRDGSDLLIYDKVHLTFPGAIEYGHYLGEHYPIK